MGQRGPQVKHDWPSVKAAYLASHHSAFSIGKIFGIPGNTVAAKAKEEGWYRLRRGLLAPLEKHMDAQIQGFRDAKAAENSQNMQKTVTDGQKSPTQTRVSLPAEERVKDIVPKGDNFRQRVAKQTDRVLDHLENQELATNLQADQFISILEKTEKVGSRARGLDTENQSSRILVNLNVLQAPDIELQIDGRDIELGQSSPETV